MTRGRTSGTSSGREHRRPGAPRGATLIELMVALSLLTVVLSIAVGLLVGSMQNNSRARVRAQLARQGEFLSTAMSHELRMAGLGVPSATGNHISDAYAGGGATDFDTSVILATATAVGVIGDFPRPDAQYNTLGLLHNRPAGTRANVMWHTENNGRCAPDTTGLTCSTATTSFFFPGEAGCAGVGAAGDRTCPWGMRRVNGGDRIQIVAGSHAWTHAGVANPLTVSAIGVPTPVISLNLAANWDAAWPNVASGDAPVGITGQGWVTTIDRVFYRLNGTNVERIQCWGDPDPDNAAWPNAATNTMPNLANLALTPTGGVANVCTAAEVVAQNVDSLTFSYFDAAGAVTAVKANVRRVDWVVRLRRVLNNRDVVQDIVGSASIRNL